MNWKKKELKEKRTERKKKRKEKREKKKRKKEWWRTSVFFIFLRFSGSKRGKSTLNGLSEAATAAAEVTTAAEAVTTEQTQADFVSPNLSRRRLHKSYGLYRLDY